MKQQILRMLGEPYKRYTNDEIGILKLSQQKIDE